MLLWIFFPMQKVLCITFLELSFSWQIPITSFYLSAMRYTSMWERCPIILAPSMVWRLSSHHMWLETTAREIPFYSGVDQACFTVTLVEDGLSTHKTYRVLKIQRILCNSHHIWMSKQKKEKKPHTSLIQKCVFFIIFRFLPPKWTGTTTDHWNIIAGKGKAEAKTIFI